MVRVPFQPIGSAKNWEVFRNLTYRVGTSQDSIVVPAGFVTDFASIPQAFQSLISPFGPYLLPSVVHDYLYWEQGCSRRQADRIFLLAMGEMQVPAAQRDAMYQAVARAGGRAWRQNARDRAIGLPRHMPTSGVRGPGPLEQWPDYRRFLKQQGVQPLPKVPVSQAFCAHGGPR
ncbi:DUF1353 domain-containing protein [Longimicrobium sp.]|uniref:DUF1353 domain-containing protein n=1 Tax=Longimicrobium sp. TaxID=2029185 RepID=UPI0039C9F972